MVRILVYDMKHHACYKHVTLQGNGKKKTLIRKMPSTQCDMCNMKSFFEIDLRSVVARCTRNHVLFLGLLKMQFLTEWSVC